MRGSEDTPRPTRQFFQHFRGLDHLEHGITLAKPMLRNSHPKVLHVRRAFLDRDRDGLLVFFVGIILLRVAAAVYFLTHLLVAAAPVVMLASGVAVTQFTSNTSRRVEGQWGGTGGAFCEDHIALAGSATVAAA